MSLNSEAPNGSLHSGELAQAILHAGGWGVVISAVIVISVPVVFEIETVVGTLLYSGELILAPIGVVVPGFWSLMVLKALHYFLLPSLVAASALVLVARGLSAAKSQSQRIVIPVAALLGLAVSAVSVGWYFARDWTVNIRENWLFAVLMMGWELLIFVWLGRRLVPGPSSRHENA